MAQRQPPTGTKGEDAEKARTANDGERERKDDEAYLQRLRAMIEEDRRANMRKNELEGQEVEKTASLVAPSLIPLVRSLEDTELAQVADQVTLKVIYNSENVIFSLAEGTTIDELKQLIERRFRVKRFRAYTPSRGELNLSNSLSTLSSEGISHMDVIHVHKQ